jgi:alkylation response protein AidB-like acyl-CoA dehydrogenase
LCDNPTRWARGPRPGTDTLSLETTAALSDDGSEYVINGAKMWTSRAVIVVILVILHDSDT